MENLNYGVIGNCRTAALVSETGSIDWLCLPDFDSPSVFSRLLDRHKGGSFGFILPEGATCSQKYISGTNILTTRVSGAQGEFDVIDFMPRYRIADNNYFIPPEVYRILRPVSGSPRLRIRFEPKMNYAQYSAVVQHIEDYLLCAAESGNESVYLYSSLDFASILESREIALEKDEFLLLSYNQKLISIDIERSLLEFERTKIYWINWAQRSVKLEKYGDIASRSLLVLKLMTYEHSGAILAALTTSIPESPGETRNWDYRYCWLRDASMSVSTLLQMGHEHSAQRFLTFIKRVLLSKQDTLQIMYGIRGERNLTEKTLDHLAGFADSRPVRIGNAAYTQKQNDVFGYLLDVVHSYYRYFGGSLDDLEDMWEVVKNIAARVHWDWRNPDCSIWEFRGREEHFVFSKIMCWVAMDRAARIADLLGRKRDRELLRRAATVIHKDVTRHGWNERLRSFTQSYESDAMDASLLLMEQYGFIAPGDERFTSTVTRVQQELFHNGLMFRYKNRDDFGLPSSAFTICTFWLARALFQTGRREEAAEIFDDVIRSANHVGLLSEDLDFLTRRQLGNFPQAYSHLALIDVAALLDRKKHWPNLIRP